MRICVAGFRERDLKRKGLVLWRRELIIDKDIIIKMLVFLLV